VKKIQDSNGEYLREALNFREVRQTLIGTPTRISEGVEKKSTSPKPKI